MGTKAAAVNVMSALQEFERTEKLAKEISSKLSNAEEKRRNALSDVTRKASFNAVGRKREEVAQKARVQDLKQTEESATKIQQGLEQASFKRNLQLAAVRSKAASDNHKCVAMFIASQKSKEAREPAEAARLV